MVKLVYLDLSESITLRVFKTFEKIGHNDDKDGILITRKTLPYILKVIFSIKSIFVCFELW